MTLHAFQKGRDLERLIHEHDVPFTAIIQAAMRKADSINGAKLRSVFPEVDEDLRIRYNSIGGLRLSDNPRCVLIGCAKWATQEVRWSGEMYCVCDEHAKGGDDA